MSIKTQGAEVLSTRANKLELLERLADNLAHEIKNPLHSMVINLEVLKRRVARHPCEESEEMLRYIGVLGGELERVNKRIELLLRLARPGRGSDLTTLNDLVEELLELIQLEAAHREIAARYEPGGPPVRVRVPHEPVRQVILNLVLEALDTLEAGDSLVIRVDREDNAASLVVQAVSSSSSGERLSAEYAGNRRLAIARRLAESVGGQVRFTGKPNGDSRPAACLTLALSLPVASV